MLIPTLSPAIVPLHQDGDMISCMGVGYLVATAPPYREFPLGKGASETSP
jgi:hypothetical protein